MTDLEMIKLCAEAMGLKSDQTTEAQERIGYWLVDGRLYDPLTFDAQAMALVKKFKLWIGYDILNGENAYVVEADGDIGIALHHDLNRAIVECVAKMGKRP